MCTLAVMIVIIVISTGYDLIITVYQINHPATRHIDTLLVMSLVVVIGRGAP